jgi:hypothetical protein
MRTSFHPLLLRHRDAQTTLAIGASYYWRLVRNKKITVLGSGKRGRATAASVLAYVRSLEAEKPKEAETGEAA